VNHPAGDFSSRETSPAKNGAEAPGGLKNPPSKIVAARKDFHGSVLSAGIDEGMR
jgi:hypothetical protein